MPEADILSVWFEHDIHVLSFHIHVAAPPPGEVSIGYRVRTIPELGADADRDDCWFIEAVLHPDGSSDTDIEFDCTPSTVYGGTIYTFARRPTVTELTDGSAVVSLSANRSQTLLVDENTLLDPRAMTYAPKASDAGEQTYDETDPGRGYHIERAPGTCELGAVAPPDPEIRSEPVAVSKDDAGCYPFDVSDAVISGSGRYLVFESASPNLMTPDVNLQRDLYRKDLDTGELRLITNNDGSIPAGGFNPSVSRDGRFVAFEARLPTEPPGYHQAIYRKDLETGELEQADVEVPDQRGYGFAPVISGDGRSVAFSARSGGRYHAFVRNLVTDRTVHASIPTRKIGKLYGGGQPSISYDGRHVAFVGDMTRGDARGHVILIRDLWRGTSQEVRHSRRGRGVVNPEISGNGRFVAYSRRSPLLDDRDEFYDVYLYNKKTRRTWFVSRRPRSGEPQNGLWFEPRNIAIDHNGSDVLYVTGRVWPYADEDPSSGEVYWYSRRSGRLVALSPKKRSDGRYAKAMNVSLDALGRRAAFTYTSPAERHAQAFVVTLR
ncbi:MAG TPA: hypothetical protein VG929_00925 [Actinomycetota bacterium]|nr:hypothetical protein [Actinomycetota bacterium]